MNKEMHNRIVEVMKRDISRYVQYLNRNWASLDQWGMIDDCQDELAKRERMLAKFKKANLTQPGE